LTDDGSNPGLHAFTVGLGIDDLAPDLAALALRHRSWCAEHPGSESNERLEFLGDAVLDLVITHELYRAHPGLPEGQLAKIRAAVVSASTLAAVAAEQGLGEALLLGKGEESSGGRTKRSLLADALEAVFGALYLGLGYERVRDLILALLAPALAAAAKDPGELDFKTRLQEYAAQHEQVPRYDVRDEGPDHAKWFFATVAFNGSVRGEGQGRSKKQAEQAAARDAWAQLSGEPE
jgi:ribonuclease III